MKYYVVCPRDGGDPFIVLGWKAVRDLPIWPDIRFRAFHSEDAADHYLQHVAIPFSRFNRER